MNSRLTFADGVLRPDLSPGTLFRTVQGAAGSYCFPYLQTGRDLPVSAGFARGDPDIRLRLGDRAALLTAEQPRHVFTGLPPGEHQLTATDGHGTVTIDRIGVGEVLAALGDSITEGYFGLGCHRARLAGLTAAQFPPEACSRDGPPFTSRRSTASRAG
ncbi:MAG: hypothetical protein HYU66_02665 [Armatimonadetes bacterium]|nr:hypothetical protein [Armatimonadota bacterium]